MKLCICNDFNECQAYRAIGQMSAEERTADIDSVYKAATGKSPDCRICIPDWEDIIERLQPR